MKVSEAAVELEPLPERGERKDGKYRLYRVSVLAEVPRYAPVRAIARLPRGLRGRYLIRDFYLESRLKQKDDDSWYSYLELLVTARTTFEEL